MRKEMYCEVPVHLLTAQLTMEQYITEVCGSLKMSQCWSI